MKGISPTRETLHQTQTVEHTAVPFREIKNTTQTQKSLGFPVGCEVLDQSCGKL